MLTVVTAHPGDSSKAVLGVCCVLCHMKAQGTGTCSSLKCHLIQNFKIAMIQGPCVMAAAKSIAGGKSSVDQMTRALLGAAMTRSLPLL